MSSCRKAAKNAIRKKNFTPLNLFVPEFCNIRKEQSCRFEEEVVRRNSIEQQKLQDKIETKKMMVEAQIEDDRIKVALMKENNKDNSREI